MGHLVLCVQRGPPPTEHFFKKGALSIVTTNACSMENSECVQGNGYALALEELGPALLLNERVPYRVLICKVSISYHSENESV